MPVKSAIVYHGGLVEYDFGPGHPFRGDRFTQFMRLVEEYNLLSDPNLELAKPEAAGEKDLLLVHSDDYIREVERRAGLFEPLSGDTPLNPSIVRAARLVVGTSLRAGEMVAEGSVMVADGVGGGLHHAGRSYGGGFCVFNDVAVCAQSLIERHGMDRVLVFDTDVHAGNGTMDIFYEEPRVLFVSVHQDPRTFYPGTGFVHQTGSGEGEGYTVNIPLPRGAGDDCMSLVIEQVFEPLVMEFRPQAIVRNGGSDPHFRDWLGGLSLTYSGLRSIGEAVAKAARSSNCGVIDLCCSGYNPATVAEGWLAIMSGVMGMDLDLRERVPPPRASENLLRETQDTIDELRRVMGEYWSFD
jgi:acetoin utilization protein AcuC